MTDDFHAGGDWLDWADHLHAVHTGSKEWSALLETLRRLTGADGARLVIDDGQAKLTSLTVGSVDDGFRQSWSRRLQGWGISMVVVRTATAFAPEEDEQIERMFEQLCQAAETDNEAGRVRKHAHELRLAVERMPIGALITNAELDVHFLTKDAEGKLSPSDGLALSRDGHGSRPMKLTVLDPAAAGELQGVLQDMLQNDEHAEHMVSVARATGRPFGLLVARLGPAQQRDPSFLILVSDPDAPTQLAPDALRRLYRLTPAESRLCAALATGHTLKTYAQSEGVSLETVRSQLKQAMIKTSTHKQAQLVRLLVTGPAAYRS